MKKNILIFIAAIIVASCSNNSQFIGKWQLKEEYRADTLFFKTNSEDFFRFRKDMFLHSCYDNHYSDYWGSDASKYEIKDNVLNVYFNTNSNEIDKKFEFSFQGKDTLLLKYIKPELNWKYKLVKVSNEP